MTVSGASAERRHGGLQRRDLNPLLAIRAVQIVLWLLVMTGPVAAFLVASQMSSIGNRLDALATAADVVGPPDTSGAEGFAELFIATYLGVGEDTTDALAPFMDGVALDGVETGTWSAVRTTSLGTHVVSPGYYSVLVAAEVVGVGLDDHIAWAPVGTRYYSVGVIETTAGWSVTGLPTMIPPPAKAAASELLIEHFDGLAAMPGVDQLLYDFLGALLTGDGDLTRYTSPSSSIVAVQPPPFASVEVLRAGSAETSDGLIEVGAVVRATDGDGRVQILEYALVVEQRDGRWEVSNLLPAPTLALSENH